MQWVRCDSFTMRVGCWVLKDEKNGRLCYTVFVYMHWDYGAVVSAQAEVRLRSSGARDQKIGCNGIW